MTIKSPPAPHFQIIGDLKAAFLRKAVLMILARLLIALAESELESDTSKNPPQLADSAAE